MAQRRPLVRVGGVFRELLLADTLPCPFVQFSTTGDLSATPLAAVTLAGMAIYTDLVLEFVGVGHDNASAQTFSVAVSTDGTNFSGVAAFTPSISSGSANHGACLLVGNGLRRNTMRCGFTTGTPVEPSIPTSTEAPRVLAVSGTIIAVRFTPTTSGNFNKGTINAYGR